MNDNGTAAVSASDKDDKGEKGDKATSMPAPATSSQTLERIKRWKKQSSVFAVTNTFMPCVRLNKMKNRSMAQVIRYIL